MEMNARRSRRSSLVLLGLWVALGVMLTSEPVRAATATNRPDTFGIEVADRDDAVVQMLKLAAGLRVMKIEPGSVGSKVTFPGTRRTLGRGDFILDIRVKGVGPDGPRQQGAIQSAADFVKVCASARRGIWEQPGHKGTLLFDVFTQAGYNMEDWKTLTFEVPLDLSSAPEPPAVEASPPAPTSGTGT